MDMTGIVYGYVLDLAGVAKEVANGVRSTLSANELAQGNVAKEGTSVELLVAADSLRRELAGSGVNALYSGSFANGLPQSILVCGEAAKAQFQKIAEDTGLAGLYNLHRHYARVEPVGTKPRL